MTTLATRQMLGAHAIVAGTSRFDRDESLEDRIITAIANILCWADKEDIDICHVMEYAEMLADQETT